MLNARVMKSAVSFTVCWLAAWCQIIVLAAMPLGPLAAGLDPLGSVPICHADADDGRPQPPPPIHGGHDCVLCVVCQSHGGSIALLAPQSALPRQHVLAVVRFAVAQPRAPPPAAIIAAQPRGPPSLT
jgi:hypothetical protein